MKTTNLKVAALALVVLVLAACSKDDNITPPEVEPVPPQTVTSIVGFYLFNEGQQNMNNASLDYYDYEKGEYRKNIYDEINPNVVKGLGDTGNDLGIYGSKLYAVVNGSNKVEVMEAATAKRTKVIDVNAPRYITFANGKAYVSAYDNGQTSANGFVAEIDTVTLQVTRKVEVGRQPEQLAIVGDKLYVTNSGGFDPSNYERTVTVIDLASFSKLKDIDIAVNLTKLKQDAYGDLYVGSNGNYIDIPSKIYVVDTKTDNIKKTYDIPVGNMAIQGDTAYVISTTYTNTSAITECRMINVKEDKLLEGSFIKDGSEESFRSPYGIAVDPKSKKIFITDATDYTSSGTLHIYSKDGVKETSIVAGVLPAHFVFIAKTEEIKTNK